MKKKAYIGIILLLSITLIGCSDNNIATVNGVPIPKEEYNQTIRIVNNTNKYINEKEYSSILENQSKSFNKNLENSILAFMIDNEIIYQQGNKLGIVPSDEEVNFKYKEVEKAINSNPNYKEIVENTDLGKEYLLRCISKDIVIGKYKKHFENTINISEKEIEDYYKNNTKDFNQNEINASHILISTVDRNKNSVNDEEKEMLKKNASDILLRINNGETFEELAKKYSDDKVTGKYGGNLGYFTKEAKNIEFTNSIFKLNKSDSYKIIETSYGYHIVKINDERIRIRTLEESKNEIKDEILNQKYIEHIKKLNEMSDIRKK
ncbi:peptidylprolyl isomerase [Romboutsia sp.]|uniref:peptidylprolyl isomerase n=1 Tax=Romboutsia sp. TaxID=1965302 RepID=UPI003F2FE796